jgi:hypothetical protein
MRTIMHADRPPPPARPDRVHLLLPFALPAAPGASGAPGMPGMPSFPGLAGIPAFARLVARARLTQAAHGEDFQRTLPHERWLAQCFGAAPQDDADAAPLAPYMLRADGGEPGDAVWACVQPVHVRIAHDHLVLIDPASLELDEADAAALLDAARPLVEGLGVRVLAPNPLRWYLSSAALASLAGASPLRASGRNIEIWLPHEAGSGARSLAWMKLQNEVQMAWFEHPVNLAREARGLPAVNSIWFHAQGAARPVKSPFARVLSDAVATRGLARAAGVANDAAAPSFAALAARADAPAAGATLVELDPCTAPFIMEDGAAWQQAFAALEANWFAPALDALQHGRLGELGLTLCGDTGSITLALTRGDLRKFWRRRTPAALTTA